MTAGPTETTVLSYGTWSSNATGFWIDGPYTLEEDQDGLSVEFDVIVKGSTAAQLATRVAAMKAQLNTEHQRLTIALDGTTTHDYTGTLADVSGSSPAAAQATKGSCRLRGDFQAAIAELYRVRLEVLKPALQTGKTAKRRQKITYTETPNGLDVLQVEIEFTPDAEGNSARVVSADEDEGFDARVAAIFTALGLTQSEFESAGKVTPSDEDDRSVTVSETWRQLPFPQSAAATNDPTMTNVFYSTRVVRQPVKTSAEFGTPGRLAQQTVTFSADLKYAGTELDGDEVIRSTVLPYVTGTIAPRATVSGERVYMGNTLDVVELPVPRVSGSVFYLVTEGTLLAASAIIDVQDFFGTTYAPIANKKDPYKVAPMDGPGVRTARLEVATEEIGDSNPELESVSSLLASELFRQGYLPVGEGKRSERVRSSFTSPDGSGEIATSVQTYSLLWRYAPGVKRRTPRQQEIEQGVGRTRTRT